MSFEEKQLEVFLRSSFFDIYKEFESKMCKMFLDFFSSIDGYEDEKYRMYYFLGWKSENRFIDYDTFNYKSELSKFEKKTSLKKLKLNDWMKMNNSMKFFAVDSLSIDSKNNKRQTLDFFSNVQKVIQLRNILAHDFNKKNLDNKYAIEILQDEILSRELQEFYKEYNNKLNFSAITDNSRILFSDIYYLERLLKVYESDGCKKTK